MLLIIIFKYIFPSNNSNNKNIFLKDTNLLIKYEKEIKRDTVVRWHEKIFYKKPEPQIIYYQKTDTVFIEKTKDLDLMLQVKKENRKLIIKAVNQNGKIIKEYVYDDVSNEFIATSQKKNIFVKSKNFYWNKIYPIINLQYSMLNEKEINYNFGLESSINYKNKIELNAGLHYSPIEKDLIINSNIKIKF